MTKDRKQELKRKIEKLYNTVHDSKGEPRTKEDAIKYVERTIFVINIERLKEFVIDRNCRGEPLEIIVSSAGPQDRAIKSEELPEDRSYMATYGKTPNYKQVVFDTLKMYDFVPEDSMLDDYSFLFEGTTKQER